MRKIKAIVLSLSLASSFTLFAHQPPRGGEPPSPETIMNEMDTNNDKKISTSEAKGPLKDHFTEIDTNNDGFITIQELEDFKPPKPPQR